ncbi:MAG: hypothetical protein A2138_19410 [Deltaproteobacteria bacterium RBG_16_71_12]|nr:MAG: hypothetical protein A2138_19410 [Deltaproteobacteria bacterium RBG_16_71_12]
MLGHAPTSNEFTSGIATTPLALTTDAVEPAAAACTQEPSPAKTCRRSFATMRRIPHGQVRALLPAALQLLTPGKNTLKLPVAHEPALVSGEQ